MNIIGLVTLGRDSELKYAPTGTAILEFSGAYNTGYGDKKETMWLRCAIYGKKGEALQQHLTKGSKIVINGDELKLTTYQKQDGTQGASMQCTVNNIEFAGGQNTGHSQGQQQPQQQPQQGFNNGQQQGQYGIRPQTQQQPGFDNVDVPF